MIIKLVMLYTDILCLYTMILAIPAFSDPQKQHSKIDVAVAGRKQTLFRF